MFVSRRSSGLLRWPHEWCFPSAIPSHSDSLPPRSRFRSRSWRHCAGSHVPAAGGSCFYDVTAAALLPTRLPARRVDCSERLARAQQWHDSGRWKIFRETFATVDERGIVASCDAHAGHSRLESVDCQRYRVQNHVFRKRYQIKYSSIRVDCSYFLDVYWVCSFCVSLNFLCILSFLPASYGSSYICFAFNCLRLTVKVLFRFVVSVCSCVHVHVLAPYMYFIFFWNIELSVLS